MKDNKLQTGDYAIELLENKMVHLIFVDRHRDFEDGKAFLCFICDSENFHESYLETELRKATQKDIDNYLEKRYAN